MSRVSLRAVHAAMGLLALGACAHREEVAEARPADLIYVRMPSPDLALSRAGLQAALQGEGKPHTWRNPDTGNTGTITPERAFVLAGTVKCREYLEHITLGGNEGVVLNTACQQADGTWRTVVVSRGAKL
jgi:hypothetical protein